MEPIHLREVFEVVDNWGRSERYTDEKEIVLILKDPGSWSDDQTFVDDRGRGYSIDDLIDKKVRVGEEVFVVIEDEDVIKMVEDAKKLVDPALKLKEALKELIQKYPNDSELGKSVRRLKLD